MVVSHKDVADYDNIELEFSDNTYDTFYVAHIDDEGNAGLRKGASGSLAVCLADQQFEVAGLGGVSVVSWKRVESR